MSPLEGGNPMFRALVIGVDFYHLNRLSSGATYPSLHGCVSDARRVEATLRQRVKDSQLTIRTLLAPHGDGGPGGDKAKWPTAGNIRKALTELAAAAAPGDQVYVHYSGHGGRVSTEWPALKSGDGVDEALVPMDIGLSN